MIIISTFYREIYKQKEQRRFAAAQMKKELFLLAWRC